MLKRGLLNKLSYTFNGYYLVNDHNDERLVKQFLGVPNKIIHGAVLLFISLCISYLA